MNNLIYLEIIVLTFHGLGLAFNELSKVTNFFNLFGIPIVCFYCAENIFPMSWSVFLVFGIISFIFNMKKLISNKYSSINVLSFISLVVASFGIYSSRDIINFSIYGFLICFLLFFHQLKSKISFNFLLNYFMLKLALLTCFCLLFIFSTNGQSLSSFSVYNPNVFYCSLIMLFCFLLMSLDLFPFIDSCKSPGEYEIGNYFSTETLVSLGMGFKILEILKNGILLLNKSNMTSFYYIIFILLLLALINKLVIMFRRRRSVNIVDSCLKIMTIVILIPLFNIKAELDVISFGNYLLLLYIIAQVSVLSFNNDTVLAKKLVDFIVVILVFIIFLSNTGPLSFLVTSYYFNSLYFFFSVGLIGIVMMSIIYMITRRQYKQNINSNLDIEKSILFFPSAIMIFMIFNH